MAKISVIMITRNEEDRIAASLGSVRWADEIIIVDSGSTDSTITAAKEFTDKVYVRDFDDFSSQKNYAVEKARNDWVLSIDADEVVPPALAEEIISRTDAGRDNDGYYVNRINHMYGKKLVHFCQPDLKLRLFRRTKGRFVQAVHEYVELSGKTGTLNNPLMHYSIRNFTEHIAKGRFYTDLEVDEMRRRGGLKPLNCMVSLLIRPCYRLLQSYFMKKGWKEGLSGAVISVNASLVELLRCFKCLLASFNTPKSGGSWSSFYPRAAGREKYDENIAVHREFIERIMRTSPESVLETGCGTGTMSMFFGGKGIHAVGIDNDEDVLERAKASAGELDKNVVFKKADAFVLPFGEKEFDVSFSQGVLEHFSDEEVKKFLKEQLRVSKKVFFSVPVLFYRNRDFGNERLMLRSGWRKILEGFNVVDDAYYMYLRRKKNLFIKLPMMYMAVIE